MKIHNIYWDTDGDGEALASLPKGVEMPSRFGQSRFTKRRSNKWHIQYTPIVRTKGTQLKA